MNVPLQAHDEAEEGCLARTVGADDAHDAVGRQHEVEVLEEHLVAESLGHMHGFEHLVAQTWTIRDEDLELLLAFLLLLVEHLVVGVESGLALGLTCLGCHSHPFDQKTKRFEAVFSSCAMRLVFWSSQLE